MMPEWLFAHSVSAIQTSVGIVTKNNKKKTVHLLSFSSLYFVQFGNRSMILYCITSDVSHFPFILRLLFNTDQ
jgi:hypothetical protein